MKEYKNRFLKSRKLVLYVFVILFSCNSIARAVGDDKKSPPPQWGPNGYSNIRYYYMPQIEVYYDIQTRQFIYLSNEKWINSSDLPAKHKGLDLFRLYKMVMADYYGPTPYLNHEKLKLKYAKMSHWPDQETIGRKPLRINKPKESLAAN